ncbi:MAG: Electron transport protein SCO1/SenC [Pedosphaera sp.]|nr:Electron transport protein SCO1/SenC [Pedosphaera sp.]
MLLAAIACLLSPASRAQSVSEEALGKITFEQKLNQQVSPDLQFRDEEGKPVKLGDYFGARPVIVVMGYYGCPMLCTLVLNGLVESLQDIKLKMGDQFDVINVSIDPLETPALAAAKKKSYLKQYGRHDSAKGWHFLTGEEPSIKRFADEIGFQYAYDAPSRQFAHPSGLVILTPQGRVARYFFGVSYSSKELNTALKEASANKVGSPMQQFLMLCFHYSPITGKYGAVIMGGVRACAIITLLILLRLMIRAFRSDAAKRMPEPVVPARTGQA